MHDRRAIIKRIREKYGYEIVPINPKSITEILVDSGMKYFCYYPDMKIAILPPQPPRGFPRISVLLSSTIS